MRSNLVVDAHAHFWRRPATASSAFGPVPEDPEVSPDELVDVARRAGVDSVVHITRTVMGYDNRSSIEGAARHPESLRVLCRFDPRPPDVAGRLSCLLAEPRVVGLRTYDAPPDDRWLVDGTLERVWDECERHAVPVAIYAPNRAHVLREIARRHPDLTVLVDHLALGVFHDVDPIRRTEGWLDVLALGSAPNVVLKVSALPEITEERFPFPRAQQLLREALETFGPDRLMWGSNFPPTLRICTYDEAIDLVRSCDFLGDADLAAILGGTALRVFGGRW